jgi:hypothetical protein
MSEQVVSFVPAGRTVGIKGRIRENGMTFLHWFEDSPKKGTAQRLEEACGAYEKRFGQSPNLILVSEHDAGATRPGCEVRVEKRIGPNNYQVGLVD